MYLGIDHSTTGVKTCILSPDGSHEFFTIERSPDEDTDWSYVEALREYVSPEDVEMVSYGYSYGDDLTRVADISDTTNRGIKDTFGLGHEFGTGTLVYDELKESDIPTTVFPGVHDDLETLHPYFRHYSPIAGADKFATARYAQEVVENDDIGPEVEGDTFIAANVSSSAMSTYTERGVLRGAFWWMGLIHGWVDGKSLRQIRDDEQDPREGLMQSGVLCRSGYEFEDIKGTPDEELLEMAYYATLHNVYSMLPFSEHHGPGVDAIVLSGRFSRITSPFDLRGRLTDELGDVAPVHVCQELSTALGAAYIARDVATGKDETLGVPITYESEKTSTETIATDD